jgi:hypothetical protein
MDGPSGSLLGHFFASVAYRVIRLSDCNDSKRTIVLQIVLVVNVFSSPLTTRLHPDTNSIPSLPSTRLSRFVFFSFGHFAFVFLISDC